MALSGKYILESQENCKEFLKALGIEKEPQDDIITDIYENDVFRLTKFMMDQTWTNTFTIGKDSELEALDGEKFKTTATLEGGKLKIQFPKYLYTAELVDGKLVEVNTIGNVCNKMVSKKTQ